MSGKLIQKINGIRYNFQCSKAIRRIDNNIGKFMRTQNLQSLTGNESDVIFEFNSAVKTSILEELGFKSKRPPFYRDFIDAINAYVTLFKEQELGERLNSHVQNMFNFFKNDKKPLSQKIKQTVESVASEIHIIK